MIIDRKEYTIREITAGYKDSAEDGVVAFNGNLNVRPAFQREFIYNDKQRNEVINTVRKGFPLNIMYWVKSGENSYELLDGQQRTISICQYCDNVFSLNYQYFSNLTKEEQDSILDYKLTVYICEGTDKEKLEWFNIINIAGEVLTEQEIRNAMYTGQWLTDAKRYFSKTSCPAYQIANKYLKGTAIRQDYLETVIKWIASKENKSIELYMAEHQHSTNAAELWLYFQSVIAWTQAIYPHYRKEMKGIDWGLLYNEHGTKPFDAAALEKEIVKLMIDEDITKKAGIYSYLLDRNERHLSIRAFTDKMKREAYEKQKGICIHCNKHFELEEMQADHITPWHLGGTTTADNCQMLCADCNRRKSGK